jgi:hypothetical protein
MQINLLCCAAPFICILYVSRIFLTQTCFCRYSARYLEEVVLSRR